jgi:hypothetical protein
MTRKGEAIGSPIWGDEPASMVSFFTLGLLRL